MPNLGYRSNKLYMRCPHCGDSADEEHGHLIVYIKTGYFTCLRCQVEGQLNFADQLGLYSQYQRSSRKRPGFISADSPSHPQVVPELGPAEWQRPSLVTRRFNIEGQYDVFETRDLFHGKVWGYHVRDSQLKQSRNLGSRAFGFHGEVPKLGSLIRLVEGPYDVVYPNDVCTYGLLPSEQQLRQLRYFRVILCPDGDVWTSTPKQLRTYLSRFRGLFIEHVERLSGDPDEIPISQREVVPWSSLQGSQENVLTSTWLKRSQKGPLVLGQEWGF